MSQLRESSGAASQLLSTNNQWLAGRADRIIELSLRTRPRLGPILFKCLFSGPDAEDDQKGCLRSFAIL